jgi:hypothetical protein
MDIVALGWYVKHERRDKTGRTDGWQNWIPEKDKKRTTEESQKKTAIAVKRSKLIERCIHPQAVDSDCSTDWRRKRHQIVQ